jgi:hypothetical protein
MSRRYRLCGLSSSLLSLSLTLTIGSLLVGGARRRFAAEGRDELGKRAGAARGGNGRSGRACAAAARGLAVMEASISAAERFGLCS